MHSHELFSKMGPLKANEILMYFRETERNLYKTIIATLAEPKKLRPVFVTQKSVPEQLAWIARELSAKKANAAAEQLLQVWLLQTKQPMLVKFLDGVGIQHDGKGAVEDLPETIDADKLATTINALVGEFEPLEVAIYLHVFNEQTTDGWPEIAKALAEDARLAVG